MVKKALPPRVTEIILNDLSLEEIGISLSANERPAESRAVGVNSGPFISE
jgi:hypothetical protein